MPLSNAIPFCCILWFTSDSVINIINPVSSLPTDEVKKEYERILKDDYFILILWQSPNSPETNLLDLGGWRTIQHVVEIKHKQLLMNENCLAKTVFDAFEAFDGYTKLAAIAKRWELVLDLILDDDGGNDLVETKRGNLTKSLLGRNLPNCDVYNMDRSNGDVGIYEIYTDSEDEMNEGGGIESGIELELN